MMPAESALSEDPAAARLRLADGRFDCRRWRWLVERAVAAVDPEVEAICPFGFELTGDPDFLRLRLRRFYVYLGLPVRLWQERVDVIAAVGDRLLAGLRQECPELARCVHGMTLDDQEVVLRPPPGAVIHLRARPGDRPLLQQWSRYLLAIPGAFVHDELPELRRFTASKSARSYLFQVTSIFHHLLGGEAELSRVSCDEMRKLTGYAKVLAPGGKKIIKHERPSVQEIDLLDRAVRPQMEAAARLLVSKLDRDDVLTWITERDFHSPHLLSSQVTRGRLAALSAKIACSYAEYQ
jgi:hypothetical protein